MSKTPQTLDDVLASYADAGVAPDPAHLLEAENMAQQRRDTLEAEYTKQEASKGKAARLVEGFNRFYPKILASMLALGDVLITLTQTVVIAFGIPILLAAMIYFDQWRVTLGAQLFEVDINLARLGAWVLVLSNVVFELVISWQEHQAGYPEPPKAKFSFRLVWRRIKYWFGAPVEGKTWQEENESPAHSWKSVLRVITTAILFAAISGSMRDVIQGTSGNWYTAIVKVFTDSTMLQMATWITGLLFTVAVVLGAQRLTRYISNKVVQIVAIMQDSGDDKEKRIADAAGLAAAYYMLAKLKEAQRYRRQTAASSPLMMPQAGAFGSVSVPTVQNGQDSNTSQVGLSFQEQGETNDQNVETKPKIEQALDLLLSDKTLMRLTTRDLEEKYPHISHSTWHLAKQRRLKK